MRAYCEQGTNSGDRDSVSAGRIRGFFSDIDDPDLVTANTVGKLQPALRRLPEVLPVVGIDTESPAFKDLEPKLPYLIDWLCGEETRATAEKMEVPTYEIHPIRVAARDLLGTQAVFDAISQSK